MIWWYWLIIGVLLLGLELFFPSFPMIWFGLGGMLTAFIMLLIPTIPSLVQAAVWAALSMIFTILWRKYLRPAKEQKLRHRNIVRREQR